MGEFNCAPYLFRPVWVEGAKESRIGYVVELSYPASVVMVPDVGILEVKNKRLHFLIRETHWRFVGYIYQALGLQDVNCSALIRLNREGVTA